MASNVWLLIKPERSEATEHEYVRGDEIIEVRLRDISHQSFRDHRTGGEHIAGWVVDVTKARTVHTDGGTAPRTVQLWELPDESAASGAVSALLAALSGPVSGVVVLGEDHRVRVVPFDELAGRS